MQQKFEVLIPSDLFMELESYSKVEGLSVNEFIIWALGEKVGELRQRRDVKNLTFIKSTKPTLPVHQPDVLNTEQFLREPKRLLRVDEAAKILRLSKSGVYKMLRSGEIPVVRIRSSVRIREEDLEKFIKDK